MGEPVNLEIRYTINSTVTGEGSEKKSSDLAFVTNARTVDAVAPEDAAEICRQARGQLAPFLVDRSHFPRITGFYINGEDTLFALLGGMNKRLKELNSPIDCLTGKPASK